MSYMKLQQLQFEHKSWIRMLEFMMEENVHMKNRLSEVLNEQFNGNLLADIELFQNEFIKEDNLIKWLRQDLAEIDKMLTSDLFENHKIREAADQKIARLRKNIIDIENGFEHLKLSFNCYLADHIN